MELTYVLFLYICESEQQLEALVSNIGLFCF